jgi:type IV pilus assembly protein PilY1
MKMHSTKPNRREAKRLGAMAVAAILLLDTVMPVYANTVSQLPGLYVTPPDANVMFTLDDSGSMQSDALPDFSLTGVDYSSMPSSGFSGSGRKLPDMWGSSSGYLNKNYYMSTNAVARYMRSAAGNPLYYDPAVLYVPWPQAATNTSKMPAAVAAAVNIDTDDPTNTSRTINLNNRVGSAGETNGYWPATYYVYKGATALKFATPLDTNNTAANFTKYEIQGSTGTGTFPKAATRKDCVATAGVCTSAEEMQNFANWLQYYRNRRLMAKGAAGAAFATQGTNLRVGFAMIGKGTVVQRGVRGFTGTDRTDFFTKLYTTASSDGGTPLRKAMQDVGEYFRTTTGVNGPWAQTPGTLMGTEYTCRRNFHVMSTDGFWNGAGATGNPANNNDNFSGVTPAKPAPANTTYTYSDTGSSSDPLVGRFGINPFTDNDSGTLADVAAYYWKTDLRPTLDNNVPSTARDPAFWQHLTTFTMGLGITGSGGVKRHADGTTTISASAAASAPELTPYIGRPWLADQAVRDWLIAKNQALDWKTPVGDAPETGDDLIHASMNGRGKYFSATNPTQVAAGLAAALAEATDTPGSLANVVTQSAQVSEGSAVYQATYNPAQWSGRFYAFPQAADGTVNTTPSNALWEASNKMPLPDSRNIFTWNPTTKVGSTFTWAGLTATQQANLGDSTVLNFLRGSDANEVSKGGTLRDRVRYTVGSVTGGVLGDVVNGSPIKGPSFGGGYERLPSGVPGQATYANYRSTTNTTLDNMRNSLFLGANDGMLHAFDRVNGVERFAFVPNSVFSVPRSPTAAELKLKMLSDPGYTHRFTVDGPPQIADAFFGPDVASASWKTVLLGTTGAGARSVFAMDVSEPAVGTTGFGTSKLLWEFSEANNVDMGYIPNYPHVAQMRDGTWVAIFGNGYDSANGQAKLFILDLKTGAVLWQQSVGAAGGNGLSQPNFTVNTNRQVTAIYAGDLKGNLWKFDVDNGDKTQWKVAFGGAPNYTPLFAGGDKQPITVMPEITFHPSGGALVSYGTGKLFDVEDTSSIVPPATGFNVNLYQQALYGIWDKPGATTGFSGISTLVQQDTNTSLAAAADSTANVTGTTTNTIDWTTKQGWYMNLGSGGERVNVNPQQINSVLLIVTNKPDADPCKSGGTSRLFALDPITGAAPSFAVFDSNGVGGITTADKGYNVKSFTFGVLSLPTLQSKKPANDVMVTERAGTRGQTGARLGGVEPPKGGSPTDCAQWLLAGGSNASIAGVDIATCKSGNPRVSWRQLK